MSPPRPRIAIIGAGPAGLTLGALLHQRGLPFALFELRPQPTEAELSSTVSGMLDLHAESGLAAMRACGLLDALAPLTTECEQGMRLLDRQGNVRLAAPGGQDRPEVSRHNLTRLLLSRVPPEAVRWGHKLRWARRESHSGAFELDFGDEHGGHVADLVVGADGAWSRVRRELVADAAAPRYTGVQNLTVTATRIGTRHPRLAELVGRGSLFALGGGRMCAGHRGPLDSERLYVALKAEEDFVRARGLQGRTAAEVAAVYLRDEGLFGGWGERMKGLIRTVCEEDARENPGRPAEIHGIYELRDHRWTHRRGVTIIGDAAHLMTPWAGEGANVSMRDALDLAGVIADAWDAVKGCGDDADEVAVRTAWLDELDPRLAAFEKTMQERGAAQAKESADNGELMFSDDGLEKMVAFFKSVGAAPAE